MEKIKIIDSLKAKEKRQEELFKLAKQAREDKYEKDVFVRGVIEISNICENNCKYCGMRKENKNIERYIMSPKEILESAKAIKNAGINTLFLQSGENSLTTDIVLEVAKKIKEELNLDIVLCLGNKTKKEYERLKKVGVEGYILKHETCDYQLYSQLRYSKIDERLQCIKDLKDLGYKVGGGNIIGLPSQTIESIAEDIILSKNLNVDYISASPFIPHENSPLKDSPLGNGDLTLNTMAVMRILLNVPIPTVSALDLVKENGQYLGFEAGANVITVNFTPEKYRSKYSLYSKKRPNKSFDEIKAMIKKAGLKISKKSYT